jgi:hypothetical protein
MSSSLPLVQSCRLNHELILVIASAINVVVQSARLHQQKVGALIPFVVACITIVKCKPLGLLLLFGIALLASGLYLLPYSTPDPAREGYWRGGRIG